MQFQQNVSIKYFVSVAKYYRMTTKYIHLLNIYLIVICEDEFQVAARADVSFALVPSGSKPAWKLPFSNSDLRSRSL